MLPLPAPLLPDAGTSCPLLLHASVLLPAECSQHLRHAAPVRVFPTPDTSRVRLLQAGSVRLYGGCASCCGTNLDPISAFPEEYGSQRYTKLCFVYFFDFLF